jgi:hypothetical protein
MILAATPLLMLADASAAGNAMRLFVAPVVNTLIAIASIAIVFFLVSGGIAYMTSSGDPEKLDHAKKVVRNALIGLVMIIAAGTLTGILSHAYIGAGSSATEKLPTLSTISQAPTSNGLTDAIANAVMGFLKRMIESAAKPFLDGLAFFTGSTPLMAVTSGVFNLWLAMVGIADALFVLVVALLGFHVMSFATFGLEEIEFKHLLPRIGLAFLLINTSIFVIDGVIGLSNGMIHALNVAFPAKSVWESLMTVANQPDTLGLAALMIMVAFLILSVMLMVYYVVRMVTLYIGAVMSPIIVLLWLLPAFKDFSEMAGKTYIGTIFVLFIHVAILQLASSIIGGMSLASPDHSLDPLMALIVGIATVMTLLKTQGALSQLMYASLGPKTATMLGGRISNVVSHYAGKATSAWGSRRSGGAEGGDNLPPTSGRTQLPPRTSPAPVGYSGAGSAASSGSGSSYPETRVAPKARKGAAA